MTDPQAAIGALAQRYALPDGASGALASLLRTLGGDDTAPTTVRAPAEAVDVHIADSLSALELEGVGSAGHIADLGAGAGFPGLVLAAALPGARVSLIEATGRKCAFIAHAAEIAGLGNVDVVHTRAEEWQEGAGACDVVTARALAPLAVIAEYAAPLLADRGTLVAWKGEPDPAEERAAAVAADVLGLELAERRPVTPFAGSQRRSLYVYSKVRETPPRFPRRAGMARKRPLGGSG